ncbi:unnamed protein product [Didymodactylos carnosus]|uniref:Uncharacterized protein n=1 Tax=Didymodactylos carnosus TaxID=1234261 RepID=A0A813Z7Z6_9BILA|nr:unnamed protein product [Didymodactylos carnosus]CAF0895528.1 unnamed protein product [Didymodactylos carnosus]CAF3612867.1 unnamed protein product [Didymodactylos carnosus]CAF3678876.1 unnamed protein product [Didymodactylos carnosus]
MPKKIGQNKEEIYEAFRQRPNSFVAFVFSGGNGGRIKDEDLVAYRAINNVYDFKTGSFLIVVNDLPTDRPPTYEGEATVKLEKLLNMNNVTVCFLDRINKKVPRERDDLRIKLGSLVAKCTPKDKGDIELQVDQIKQLNEAARKQQEEFQNELRNLQGEIKKRQDEFNQSKKDFEKKLDGLRDELKKKDEAVERTQAQQRELESRVNALNIDMIKQKADHDLQLAQERDAASRQLLEQEHKTRMEELQREMIAAQEAIAIAEKKLDEGCVIL